jgi:ferric-dicitrate binding protein FerR (iron transport regulator)
LPSFLLQQRARAHALWADLRRRRPAWLLASAALLAGGLVWLGWPRIEPAPAAALAAPRPGPPPLPELPARAAPAEPELLELPGGASVALRAESAVLPQELADERIRLQLLGGARFEVPAQPARGFAVESAQVLVRVLGATTFSVDPQDARTRVAVERGRVQVMWWSGATVLRAGESAVFPPESESAFSRRSFSEAPERPPAKRAKHVRKRKKVHAARNQLAARPRGR